MPLKACMSLAEIREYLEGDIKRSIRNDVGPVVQPEAEEGGYFAVPRLVLSYVDFLGALYCGYKSPRHRGGRRRIATSDNATKFIREIMKEVDGPYEKSGDLLYEMYRHGTIHRYEPHKLRRRSDGRFLSWLAYKGPRESWVNALPALKVRHLQPVLQDASTDYFPVSITCLYEDLILALGVFWDKLRSDQQLVDNWCSAAEALCEPEETRQTW